MKTIVKEWVNLKRTNKDIKITLKGWVIRALITDVKRQDIENIFYPTLINSSLVQFTNYQLISNGSGDSYYLVKVDGKYMFFKIGFEPDCNEAYYYGHLVCLLDVLTYIDNYEVNICYNSVLLDDLKRIA